MLAAMTSINDPGLAALAMRLRQATEQTPVVCADLLRPLSAEMRLRYVERFESSAARLLLCDPLEVDPQFGPIIAAIGFEAKELLESGALGDGRRGRSGRMWGWMQRELLQRHGIEWKTPLEMTPGVALD